MIPPDDIDLLIQDVQALSIKFPDEQVFRQNLRTLESYKEQRTLEPFNPTPLPKTQRQQEGTR